MTRIYEGMFLLDNDAVRAGWDSAKGIVTGLLEKHGGKAQTARRWDERRLAYPIKHRKRATYLLAYYEIPADKVPDFVRDLDISESVLRYLLTRAESVPAKEMELSQAELASDFSVPEPPDDSAPEPEEVVAEAAAAEGEKSEAPAKEGEETTEAAATEEKAEVAAGAPAEGKEE